MACLDGMSPANATNVRNTLVPAGTGIIQASIVLEENHDAQFRVTTKKRTRRNRVSGPLRVRDRVRVRVRGCRALTLPSGLLARILVNYQQVSVLQWADRSITRSLQQPVTTIIFALKAVSFYTVFALFQFGLGLAYFYSPDPKKFSTSNKTGPEVAQMGPELLFWGRGRVGFGGFEPNHNVGQGNPQLPRANEHIA